MSDVVAVALAGGQGVRARPMTLEGPGHVRSKAVLCLAGRPVIEWQVATLQDQGVEHFYVVANGRQNRYQIKDHLGYGDALGVEVQYSRARMDRHNTGSGEATLSALEHWGLRGLALVFPTDSLFEFDLAEMVWAHRRSGAVVTIGAVELRPEGAAGKYGTMVADAAGWVRAFVEKPALEEIRATHPDRVPINAGLYLVDCARLRRLARRPDLVALTRRQLDWGGDLLPWLVAGGYPVRLHPVSKIGDLGNVPDYLATLADLLAGGYPQLLKRMEPPYAGNVWIHESSLLRRDPVSGMSLAAKLAGGVVTIGPNVQIGRDVEIGPGVVLRDTAIGDGVDLHQGCRLNRVACLDGVVVGTDAMVSDTFLGLMARVESSRDRPTVLDACCALGHEVTVPAGTRLSGVTAYPGLTVPAGTRIPSGTVLTERLAS
jgi:mannose-1-phosphate guanylyltransferase / phosphomannomutase